MQFILLSTEDNIFYSTMSWHAQSLHILISTWNQEPVFHCLSTRVRHHIMFSQRPSTPKAHHKAFSLRQQSPPSSQALQLLQTQLNQHEKHLCLHSFFLGRWIASSPSCAVEVEERDRGGGGVRQEWAKIPLYVCQGGIQSYNYSIGGFGL